MQRKNEIFLQKFCPRCGSPKLKNWDELGGDEKFMIEKLPSAEKFSAEERKHHRFCTRCFYEETAGDRNV